MLVEPTMDCSAKIWQQSTSRISDCPMIKLIHLAPKVKSITDKSAHISPEEGQPANRIIRWKRQEVQIQYQNGRRVMRYQSVHCISEVLMRAKTEIVGGKKSSPYSIHLYTDQFILRWWWLEWTLNESWNSGTVKTFKLACFFLCNWVATLPSYTRKEKQYYSR